MSSFAGLDLPNNTDQRSVGSIAMDFYREMVYPALVSRLGNPKPIQALREQIVPLARGVVLEIGVGSGANFPYYDQANVERLYALEPNPGMLRLADAQRRRTSLDIQFLALPGERIPLDDESVDTVVSTFTLCTIPALEQALRGIERVLKIDGLLIFLENSLAADPHVQSWQRRWEPIHRRVFKGLLLTRDIPALIGDAGFRVTRVERLYLSRFPKSWTHCCWGTASRS
jgi:ubiquinone/menaquinone biosynthesis C-methylase UbiE